MPNKWDFTWGLALGVFTMALFNGSWALAIGMFGGSLFYTALKKVEYGKQD